MKIYWRSVLEFGQEMAWVLVEITGVTGIQK